MEEERPQPELIKRTAEAAEEFLHAGQYENAGLMFLRLGDDRRAAQAFWKGGQFKKAAECALRQGFYLQAAEAYAKAGEHLLAAKAYTQVKEVAKAAAAYEAAGKLQEAARMHLLAHNYLKAGELYDKLGDPMRSALAYEHAIASAQPADPSSTEDMARMAQILERVKQYDKAAQIYLQMQQVNEALMVFLKGGDVPGAARLYSSCQGGVSWEILDTAKREGPERLKQVAEMFFFAKDYAPSGEAFRLAADFGKAARAFEAAGEYAEAADCFVRAGLRGNAARMYERAGKSEQAAPLWVLEGDLPAGALAYERASLPYDAGDLYMTIGQYDKAIEQFQKVPDIHPHFLEASDRIAKILGEKGRVDIAVGRYEAVLRRTELREETLFLRYHLALILIEKGSFGEALEVLKAIAAFKPGYRDVASLLAACERALAPAEAPSKPGVARAPSPVEAGEKAPSASAARTTVQHLRGMEALQDAVLLQELNLADLRHVLASGRSAEVAKGGVVISAGEKGQTLYILLEGLVKVVSGKGESEEILAVLVPGEHFGEMSLLEEAPTSATVIAMEKSLLFALDRKALETILSGSDALALKFYRAFVKTLSQRLRKINVDLVTGRGSMS
jgi:tetratricopeptide (TPR) repeat protein